MTQLRTAIGIAAVSALLALTSCDRGTPTTHTQAPPMSTKAATVPAAAQAPAPVTPPPTTPAADTARPKPINVSGSGSANGAPARQMTASSMQAEQSQGTPPSGVTPATTPTAPGIANPVPTPVVPEDAPKMVLDKNFIDFGTVYKDDPVTSKITYKNEGKSVLTNIEFRPSCGCTVVQGYKQLLQPGETSTVDITFNPKGHPGKNAKSVTVSSSDPLAPQQILRFECNYVPLVQLSPPVIQFGTVVAGNEGKALLTITSRDKDFKITKIDIDHSLITSRTTDDDTKSEDPLYPGRQVFEFVLDKNAPTGSISAKAKITVQARAEPNQADAQPQEVVMEAAIIAHILGDMVIEPRFIRIAQAFPGEKFSEKVLVTSASGKQFNVTSVTVAESTLPGLTARTEPVNTGGLKGHYLILEGTGGESLGMFRGYIEVKSDLPNESAVRVQFNGFVREKPQGESQ